MNLPAHIVGGGVLALVGSGVLGLKNSIGLFCFASFLDVDHYVYYVLKLRSLNLSRAVEYFDRNKHTERFCLCVLHTTEFFALFALAAWFSGSAFIYACFTGFLLHIILDIAQGLYYRRMHYRWWSVLNYLRYPDKKGGAT
jgi:hypothetical protein